MLSAKLYFLIGVDAIGEFVIETGPAKTVLLSGFLQKHTQADTSLTSVPPFYSLCMLQSCLSLCGERNTFIGLGMGKGRKTCCALEIMAKAYRNM